MGPQRPAPGAALPSGIDPEAIAAEHRDFGRLIADPLAAGPRAATDRTADRRLRVGYVTSDVRLHAISFFLAPLLEEYDRGALEVFCYSDARHHGPDDEHTRRVARSVDGWRDVDALTDEQLAELVRRDRIDVLVDLAGHTAFNRLPVFARRPAPLQVTYLGYPDTTGLTQIDYRFDRPGRGPARRRLGSPARRTVGPPRPLRLVLPAADRHRPPPASRVPSPRRRRDPVRVVQHRAQAERSGPRAVGPHPGRRAGLPVGPQGAWPSATRSPPAGCSGHSWRVASRPTASTS